MQRDENGKLLDCDWIFYIGQSAYSDESHAFTVGLSRQTECREYGKHMGTVDTFHLPKHWGYQKCKDRLETPILETLRDTYDTYDVRFSNQDMLRRGCKPNNSSRTDDWFTDSGVKIIKTIQKEIDNFRIAEGIFK